MLNSFENGLFHTKFCAYCKILYHNIFPILFRVLWGILQKLIMIGSDLVNREVTLQQKYSLKKKQ
jgi:hypothetical protein